jgi:hypothetical protein
MAALLEVIKESAFDSHDKQYLAHQVLSAVHGDSGLDRVGVWDYCTVSDGGC